MSMVFAFRMYLRIDILVSDLFIITIEICSGFGLDDIGKKLSVLIMAPKRRARRSARKGRKARRATKKVMIVDV